jgi:tRNA threonylcarbamoyladenosine biosynthesis protein TsaE
MSEIIKNVTSATAMHAFGVRIGERLHGGECIELVGDVGAGKTTFVKGLAEGLKISDDVQSPSFTVSRVYAARDGLRLDHYDFYRLPDPGILEFEFAESIDDTKVVTVVEWAAVVSDVLSKKRLVLAITPTDETTRRVVISGDDALIKEVTSA